MSGPLTAIQVRSPAKVNLFLEVLRRRPDGYHDLRSLFMPLDLHDEVLLDPAPPGVFESRVEMLDGQLRGGDIPSDTNLTTRMVRLLAEHVDAPCGISVLIRKRIPVGGGLGGGSSNAAAAALGALRLWERSLAPDVLRRLACSIGCDVPAFLLGGSVLMEGVGDVVAPLPAVDTGGALVLVNPLFAVSTGDIYRRHVVSLTREDAAYKAIRLALQTGNLEGVTANLYNSLQATAFRKYVLLELLAERLREAGALGVLLSGSGGTVFGMASSYAEAERIAGGLRSAMGDAVWCRTARLAPDCPMV